MPQITGVDFLQEAMEIFPDAKRVLLTAYADTDAAIRSINKAKIDFYLMKPWTPPEQNLYPVLDDLLDDWMASFHPEFEGIRVIGLRWSAKSHEIRDFLARNGVPFQWLDIEADNEARRLASYASSTSATTVSSFSNSSKSATLPHLPLVILPDGSQLMEPTTTQLAEKLD
jgi:thioredoxin reductase (NADPH)